MTEDRSLHFSSGIDNSQFLEKIEEMMKAIDELANLTSKDAALMVDSLSKTGEGLDQMAQELIQVKDLELSASLKKRTAREAEIAITEAMMRAEGLLREQTESINKTYEEQAAKVREIEKAYTEAQVELEHWRKTESYDETIYHRQLEGLTDVRKGLAQQKEELTRLREETKIYGQQVENSITKAKQTVTDYKEENKRAAEEAYSQFQQKRTNDAVAAMSTRQLAEAYVNQKVAITEMEAEIRKGNVARKEELHTEKESLTVLENTLFSRAKGMTLMREFTDMLMKENMVTREASAYKMELEDTIKHIGTAYRESTRAQQQMVRGGGQIAGVVSGIQGMMGAFTAAQGVIAMFAKNNEDLVKIQTKLQSVMAITMGLQQIHNTLHKTSAFRIQTVTAATRLYTQAQNGLAIALNLSDVAAKKFMATLTLGLSIVITAIVTAITKWISKIKEQREEQRLAAEELKQTNEKIVEQTQKVSELVAVLESSNASYKVKVEALKQLQEIIPDLNGKIDEQTGAVDLNREAIEKYIASIKLEIEAEILRGKMKDAVTKQMGLAAQLQEKQAEGTAGKSMFAINRWIKETNKLYEELQDANIEVANLTGELTELMGKLLTGDADKRAAEARKKALQEYIKTAEKAQEAITKLNEKLNEQLYQETLKMIERDDAEFAKALQAAFDAQIKAIADAANVERELRQQMSVWRIKNIKDENERALAQNEKDRADELRKVEDLKRKYLQAMNLSELSGEMQTMLETLTTSINQFYVDQRNELLQQTEGTADVLRKQAGVIFSDISVMSATFIKQVIDNAEEYIKSANLDDRTVASFRNAIDKANEYLVKKNPFDALRVARDRYQKAMEKLDAAKANKDIEAQTAAMEEMASATSTAGKAIDELGSIFNETLKVFNVVAEALGIDSGVASALNSLLSATSKLAVEMTKAIGVMGKMASTAADAAATIGSGAAAGGIVGAIIGVVAALAQLVMAMDKAQEAAQQERITKYVDGLNAKLNSLKRNLEALRDIKGIGDGWFTIDLYQNIINANKVYREALSNFMDTLENVQERWGRLQDEIRRSTYGVVRGEQGGALVSLLKRIEKTMKQADITGYFREGERPLEYSIDNLRVYINLLKDLQAQYEMTGSEVLAADTKALWEQLEAYVQAYEDLQETVRGVTGDISNSTLAIVNAMWKEIKVGGDKTFADLTAAAKDNIAEVVESMVSQQLWATTMSGYFDTLGEGLVEAISGGGDILSVFNEFWEGMEAGLKDYTDLYDAFLKSAAAAGWDFLPKDEVEKFAEGSLGWIEEKLKKINEELRKMSAEELETEYGQALLERLRELEGMKDIINDIISGKGGKDVSERTEGSILWLREQIAALQNELDNLSEAEYTGERGAAIAAQIREYENALDTLLAFYDILQDTGHIKGSIDDLRQRIGEMEAELSALSPEDFLGAAGESLNAEIERLKVQLKTLEEFYKAIEEMSEEQELLERSLQEFETAEKEKERIVKEYTEKIAVLRKYGYDEEADLAERALADYLSDVALAGLESKEEWQALFENMVDLTVQEAKAALTAVIELVEEAEDLTQEKRDEILADLQVIQKQIDDLETKEFQKRLEQVVFKIKEIEDGLSAVANVLRSLEQNELADAVAGIATLASSIGALVTAIGSMATDGVGAVLLAIAGVITGIIQTVKAVSNLFSKEIDTSRVEALADEYNKLARAIENAAGAERKALQQAQRESLLSRQRELELLIGKEEKKERYWWDILGWFSSDADKAKILEWQSEIEAIDDLIVRMEKDWQTDYLTTSFIEFSRTIAEIASDTTRSVEEMEQAISEAVQSMIRNMIVEFLRIEILEAPLKAMFDKLWQVSDDGRKMIDMESLKEFEKEAQILGREFYDTIMPMFEQIGGVGASALRDRIKSITEPQADILIGEVHGVRIVQVEMKNIQKAIEESVKEGVRLNAEMLIELQSIRLSNNELYAIHSILQEIKDKNVLAGTGLGV